MFTKFPNFGSHYILSYIKVYLFSIVIMDVYLAAMMGIILSLCLPTTISAAPPTVDAPHCRNIGCCSGRDDNCYVPISNSEFGIAVCYCDDFCLRSASSDCCTDFPLLCVQSKSRVYLLALF